MRVVMVPGWQAKTRAAADPKLVDITSDVAMSARGNIIRGNHYDTGDLLDSIRQVGRKVFIGTDHWHFIEYGTRPHVIRPATKRALYWPGADHPVAYVNHPGNPPYAPMRRALETRRG
jgi:hypothetical protein